MTLRDNVVYATKDAGFHQHYGTDNLITNNIFAFSSTLPCDPAVAGQCDRAAVRSSQHMDCYDPRHPTHEAGCNSSFTFTNNIVLLGAESLGGAPANIAFFFFLGVADSPTRARAPARGPSQPERGARAGTRRV